MTKTQTRLDLDLPESKIECALMKLYSKCWTMQVGQGAGPSGLRVAALAAEVVTSIVDTDYRLPLNVGRTFYP